MNDLVKQQSNPFSTGSGGANFETRMQAAFVVLMLTGRVVPCLPSFLIKKIKLQGQYAGYNTDDFILFCESSRTGQSAKLLGQIKHEISITARNQKFADVIQGMWRDFNSESFDKDADVLALVTGPLSATDIRDARSVLEWARQTEDEEEFLLKIETPNFSSDAKRNKLEAFRSHLTSANDGNDVSDRHFWEFLRAFHLLSYDLDTEAGGTLSFLQSLIEQVAGAPVGLMWARIVDAVQTANQHAGTLTVDTLPRDILDAFKPSAYSEWRSDVARLFKHGEVILNAIRTTVGGVYIEQPELFSQLVDTAEATNFVFVTGERGSGKSSLVRQFYDHMSKHSPVLCLRIEDLNEPHLDIAFASMGLQSSLSDLEAGFALMPKRYLIIESIEKLLELEHTNAFTDLLQLLEKQAGWTVVATGRDYAYQQIVFNFLQPVGLHFDTVRLEGFSDKQREELQDKLPCLQALAGNKALQSLLRNPFYVELAFRVLQMGAEFTAEDGEKELRAAVWRDVIAREQERTGGMPLRRRQVFTTLAVDRAKRMVYGVPESGYDGEALLKLEEDNLVRRDRHSRLVSPAHDVLEDWALVKYIEEGYQKHSDQVHTFLQTIGHEPAISRAFRLWLHQKLTDGDNVTELVGTILNDNAVQRHWQDQVIAAVLHGSKSEVFLRPYHG